jgi:hypothetical protein
MPNDDFTGIDGNPPNSAKWSVTGGSPVISSNTVEVRNDESAQSLFYFKGDFDVQIDFDVTGAPSTNSWGIFFVAYIDGTHAIQYAPCYTLTAKNYQRGYANGGGFSYNTTARATDTGKVRIVRSGASFTLYHWTGAWTAFEAARTIGSAGDKVYIQFAGGNWGSYPAITAYLDNFVINSGVTHSNITPNNASSAHSAQQSGITQFLGPNDADHAHNLDQTIVYPSVGNAYHQHLLCSPIITQEHEIAPADMFHIPEFEHISVTIEPDDAVHSHAFGEAALTCIHCPAVQNVAHTHALTFPVLTQTHNLVVQNSEHLQAAGEPWFLHVVTPDHAVSALGFEAPSILEMFVVLAGVGSVTTHLELTGTCVLDSAFFSEFVADGELALGGDEAAYDVTYPGVSAFEGGGYLVLDGQCALAVARTDAFVATGHLALGGILTLDGPLTSSPPHYAFVGDGYLSLEGEAAFAGAVPPSSGFVADGYLKLGDLSAKVGTTSHGASDRAFAGSGFLELGGYGVVNSPDGTVFALVAYTGAGASVMLLSSNASVGAITPTAHKFGADGELVMGEVDLADSDKFDTWALTGHAFEPAVYSGFDFNSYCMYRGRAYGAKDDGIYLLEGDDDAGSKINTGIRIGPHNYGRDVQKRLRSIRLGGNSNGARVRVITGQGDEGLFSSDKGKVQVSRDLEDRELTVDILGFKELSHLEIVPLYLVKR